MKGTFGCVRRAPVEGGGGEFSRSIADCLFWKVLASAYIIVFARKFDFYEATAPNQHIFVIKSGLYGAHFAAGCMTITNLQKAEHFRKITKILEILLRVRFFQFSAFVKDTSKLMDLAKKLRRNFDYFTISLRGLFRTLPICAT